MFKEEAIVKCIKIHGNKYSYDLFEDTVVYRRKVKIICPVHGIFEQKLANHLMRKQGCAKCAKTKNLKTNEQFIKEAKEVHGDLFCYDLTDYTGGRNKIIITCKTHGNFRVVAYDHIKEKLGCPNCDGRAKLTSDGFIEKANGIHNSYYDYSLIDFNNLKSKLKIICPEHGIFKQVAFIHLRGNGCQECGLIKRADARRNSKEWFVENGNKIHGQKYDYSKVDYQNNKTEVIIICKIHGEFLQKPAKHIYAEQGCPKCGGTTRRTNEDFIQEANEIHNNFYDYSLVNYKNKDQKVTIICPIHGEFEQIPHNHLWSKAGCPKCSQGQKSKIEQEWLDFLNIPLEKRNVQLKVKGRIIKTDAFDEETNTIYEFYGDFFHGNPKVVDVLEMNKLVKKNFGTLHRNTLDREKFLKENGFNLVTIWEADWKEQNGIKVHKQFTPQSKFENRYQLYRYYQSYVGWGDEEDFYYILNLP